MQTQCQGGASDFNVDWETPITFWMIFEHFKKDQGKNGMTTTPRNVKARSGAASGYNQVHLFISTCTFMLDAS